MRQALLLIVLLLALPLRAFQQEEPRDPPEAGLGALVTRLGSSDFEERRKATEELLALGSEVAGRLRELREGLPLEARLRVDEILARLEGGSGGAPPFRAARVTLDVETLPLARLVERLGGMSGTPVTLDGRPAQRRGDPDWHGREVSFRAEDEPVFKALDRLCRDQGLVFRRDYTTGGVILQRGLPPEGPAVYPGPLRIALRSFSITRQTTFRGSPSVTANLQLQVDVEAGYPVLGVVTPLVPRRAVDDRDRSLRLEEDSSGSRVNVMRMGPQGRLFLNMRLAPPERDALHIKTLEGVLEVLVPTSTVTGVLRAPLEKGRGEAGHSGMDLKMEEVNEGGARRQVVIGLTPPAPEGDPPLPGSNALQEQIQVLDASGEPVRPAGRGRRISGGRVQVTLMLPDRELQELRVTCVRAYEVRRVPFVFQDVPIP